MNFDNKNILVLGLARSGLAAIYTLHKRGANITACDIRDKEQLTNVISELKFLNIEIFVGGYPEITKEQYDVMVVSPGVPLDIEPVQNAINEGIKVIGEVELAYLLKSPEVQMYAVTGTNGKTTTTALLQNMFEINGDNSVAGGNIGVPLVKLVDTFEKGIISVEVSSFQLESIEQFQPHICGILNITPDHLDRHKTMQNYIDAKAKIFKNQNSSNYTILNYEDETVKEFKKITNGKAVLFSTNRVLNEGVFIENDTIISNLFNKYIEICNVDDVKLLGKHNLENALCAVAMGLVAGLNKEVIHKALTTFDGVSHRLEKVAIDNDVLYINDSKATNPESTIKAIESFKQPVILIAGGRAKGADFSGLAELVANKVKCLVLIGEAKDSLKRAVIDIGFTNIYETDDFYDAVEISKNQADKGDVVLLSPACASWDMFKSYEERGNLFCQIVNKLINDKKLDKSI
ncbi:UDP-N-acetylmuramoyl-L-alanine--D-glutamate ligase [Candidatus Syntrophocurvum alkaliphilum]|uniref:UDP-N-acetylmuramoylalanine--D-glutamate ligase n=1 Tax=Candidatus Syntrophocurvum alkaliphilum TaxID=2293317 RepID=A0A6I6DCN9_9FIRM|nr:UDP-N-acetylmuramoyl-L-alanine--D-glutamate ligase [Candidatus Syntrophocurvum alkaliphilum]QGT99134.1 UDP-N-acetylmuramoyl-L-alanine--D-glutamate ligase [Candidatus Syntrophocurvum alkaliphilum]